MRRKGLSHVESESALAADGHRLTVAVLAAFNTIQGIGSDGEKLACMQCLFVLLRSALARFEPLLFNGRKGPAAPGQPVHPFAGAAVRRHREAAGLTRAEVVRRAGRIEATIRSIDCGRHRLSARVLWHLMSLRSLGPGSDPLPRARHPSDPTIATTTTLMSSSGPTHRAVKFHNQDM